jgi:hypothetical protein
MVQCSKEGHQEKEKERHDKEGIIKGTEAVFLV